MFSPQEGELKTSGTLFNFPTPTAPCKAVIRSSPACVCVRRARAVQALLCGRGQLLAGCGQAPLDVSPVGSLSSILWALESASGPLGKKRLLSGAFARAKRGQVSFWPHSGSSASQELTLQMNLLELIRKLQQRGCQAGKAAL